MPHDAAFGARFRLATGQAKVPDNGKPVYRKGERRRPCMVLVAVEVGGLEYGRI